MFPESKGRKDISLMKDQEEGDIASGAKDSKEEAREASEWFE